MESRQPLLPLPPRAHHHAPANRTPGPEPAPARGRHPRSRLRTSSADQQPRPADPAPPHGRPAQQGTSRSCQVLRAYEITIVRDRRRHVRDQTILTYVNHRSWPINVGEHLLHDVLGDHLAGRRDICQTDQPLVFSRVDARDGLLGLDHGHIYLARKPVPGFPLDEKQRHASARRAELECRTRGPVCRVVGKQP